MLYASDLITQYLPWYYLVAQSLRQFRLPHWVSQINSGYPLLAQGETGVLCPINSILLTLLPFPLAVTSLYLAYFLLAVTGLFSFLRQHRLDKLSSLLGSFTFALSGFMLSRYFQPSIIFTAALLPWGMSLIHRHLASGKISFWLPLLIYLQITAGHLQITLISLVAYLSYALIRLLLEGKKLLPFYTLIAMIVFGLGLSAVQLFPSIKLFNLSQRRHWDPMIRFTYSLPPSHLITYLQPQAFGISEPGDNLGFTQFGGSFWEFNLTIWTLPFIFSLFPLINLITKKGKKDIKIVTLYLLWILFLLLSFGGYFRPYRLVARLPQFPFRAPSRFLLVATFAASTLAAFGFHQLVKKHPFPLRLLVFLLIITSACLQAFSQLKNYFITTPSLSIIENLFTQPLTTPLPLDHTLKINPNWFVVEFHRGLIISLLSASILIFIYWRTQKGQV